MNSAVPVTTLPNVRGGALTEADYLALESRWITREIADAACRRINSIEGAEIVGFSGKSGTYSGILIPYVWPGENHVREYRLRRDFPDLELRPDGSRKAVRKYLAAQGRGNLLYFAPGIEPRFLDDLSLPIIVVEGEFKTLALARLAWHSVSDLTDLPGFLATGISGVYNWWTRSPKTINASGARVDNPGPISDLSRIAWMDRHVTILFDADLEKNIRVRGARLRLTQELEGRGAYVSWFRWPKTVPLEQKGIDDYLAANGPDAVLQLLSKARLITKKKPGTVVVLGEVPAWKSSLIVNETGAPRAILANAITALREAPEWDGVLGFNEFTLCTTMLNLAPWLENEGSGPWTDQEDRLTADWLQHRGIHVTVRTASEAVQTIAAACRFHPVRTYLDGLCWDGKERAASWLSAYLGANSDPYSKAAGERWLVSGVARIFQPGCKADCSIILEGTQGLGKSTVFAILGREWFTDELAEIGSKDASMQTHGVWIIEIAELDSMTRTEVGKIKAFLSRRADRFRPPYGRHVIEAPRQCVFAGTVNDSTYLRDPTGGRRFWPVACAHIDLDALARDRDQLWAEARERYRAGAQWWMDTPELIQAAEQEQADRYAGDPWDQPIAEWIEKPTERCDASGHPVAPFTSGPDSVCVEDILHHCIGKRMDQWTQGDKSRVAHCLRLAGWEKHAVLEGDGRSFEEISRERRGEAP